jgi:hypothetical protein
VRDSTNDLLPGATVTITGAALVAPRTVITDDQGRYELDSLPAGRYVVEVSLSGFEPGTTAIDIEVGARTLDLVLAGHFAAGQPVQLVVDERSQLLERGCVSLSPPDEETRDLMGLRSAHELPSLQTPDNPAILCPPARPLRLFVLPVCDDSCRRRFPPTEAARNAPGIRRGAP